MADRPPKQATSRDVRRARDREGRRAEWIAAVALRLRGYRILARREKTPAGEIDIVAVRGRRLAFVEVKRRATREACEAAVTANGRARVRRAAGIWLARNTRYQAHDVGFDLVFLIGWGWPRYIENGL
ncbi:MAG: YraN family protein [Hyphomicrobium sp.]|uniref:YraN family protein n=1 Tax=Hyphomicrobium sp. TaxID=82 RepID=UPI003D0FB763